MDIGAQIKKYRTEAKMSQKELGQKIGMSQQQIAQYETGKRMPKIETINSIAGALNIGIKRLYPGYREEWIQTETYKTARKYHEMREAIISILSSLYGTVEKNNESIENSHYDINYTITINDKIYNLTIEDLNKLIDYVSINFPFLITTIVKNSGYSNKNSKSPTD